MKKANKPSYQGAMKEAQRFYLLHRKEFLAELKKPVVGKSNSFNPELCSRLQIHLELARLRWMLVEIARAVGVFKK